MIIKSQFLKPGINRKMELLENYYLQFDDSGLITYFGRNKDNQISLQSGYIDMCDKIITPGFIDLHTHIPQFPAIGLGKGTLLNWLDNYIFPLEEKFNNPEYAYYISRYFFESSLKYGTTTVVAYSNSSYDGTDAAFLAAKNTGIRAFIGLSLMDMNSSSKLINSTVDNIHNATKLISKWHKKDDNMLNFVISPRYALNCSKELMNKSAMLAKEADTYIQTHLAENKDELKLVAKAYPESLTYTNVYDEAGLITDKTLLAHCIYLSDNEISILKTKGASVVHCPSSNRFLGSGVFPFAALEGLLTIGLGTDIAGGTSVSLLNEVFEAVETYKSYNKSESSYDDAMTTNKMLWTATKGNAEILGISDITGDFEVGLFADFVAFSTDRLNIFEGHIDSDTTCDRIAYLIRNRYADNVYLRGKEMYNSGN